MYVPIAYAITESYVKPLMTSLASLFDHARKETFFAIYVMVYCPSMKLCDTLHKYVAENHPRSAIRIMSISARDYARIPVLSGWLREASFRLLLPQLLSEEERVLYLDADTIILDDLSELIQLNLEDRIVAGVADVEVQNIDGRERLAYLLQLDTSCNYNQGISKIVSHQYINSGVLLMNLEYWRQHAITERALQLMELPIKRWLLPDQDLINYLIMERGKSHMVYLPVTYNCIDLYFPKDKEDNMLHLTTAEQIISQNYRNRLVDMSQFDGNRIKIIHMVSLAPWQKYKYPSPYYELYKPYAEHVSMTLPTWIDHLRYTLKREIRRFKAHRWISIAIILLGFLSMLMITGGEKMEIQLK
ncbi:glycosyltransferase family 8 protein [Entomospira nematocerorum]|uniref:Glycosyltransferase family 8 protein n=1 Tax=Entomospira nematocerorum TaxID=2719987 RepID=A0A968GCJ7_9SPIO|nr:glycosyltransferase family 8 protein [Entomospira nematocera]NIZ47294.1 glycosyltransferase family 8 protein [Entomospira nematocera]WDI34164.1 glycosyltransferase family 8 protein [Entomospira nematocera]